MFVNVTFQQDVLLPVLEEQEREAADKSRRDKEKRLERKRKRVEVSASKKKTSKEPAVKKSKKRSDTNPAQQGLFTDPHPIASSSVSFNQTGNTISQSHYHYVQHLSS